MKIYGYCRVSTTKQSLKRQIETIRELYPDAVIVTDKTTGRNFDRPGWLKLYKQLEPGTTVVFDEVSRMSRDATEGFQIYQELFERGVNLIFVAEPHINTSVFREVAQAPETGDKDLDETLIKGLNEYLMRLAEKQIRIAFEKSQSEVDNNSRRTSNGIREKQRHNQELILKYGSEEEARKDPTWAQIGQLIGAKLTTKKSIKAKEIIRKHSRDFDGTLSDVDVIKLIGCARGSYYKYKKELLREELKRMLSQ